MLPFVSVFAVSFALLVDEIMLSAIFSVLLGAGNTVSAIAVALVGLSASGIVAYAIPAFHRAHGSASLARALLFWFGVSLMLSTLLVMSVPLNHGDLIYFRGDPSVRLWSLAVYQIAVVPFFLGGLAIALLLRGHAASVSRLYFWDLAGAALGCLLAPFLLPWLGAPRAILFAALPAALLGAPFALAGGPARRALLAIPLAVLAASALRPGLLSFSKLNTMGEVRSPAYQSFPVAAGDIDYEKWALDAWTIIRNERIPQQWQAFEGWGLSPHYRGPVPRTLLINYNTRFSTYVTRFDGDFEPIRAWLDADLSSLHYLLGRRYDTVLNIGAGGGREVLNALNHDAKRVVAVDVSEVVVTDLMKERLLDFSGALYLDPRVEAVADEGRTFTERASDRFDLIDFSIVGGINLEKMDLVRVDDLFTREALNTYVSRLADRGVFSYVMYSTRRDLVAELAGQEVVAGQPYVPALRTLAGLRLALEDHGVTRLADHVLVASLPGLISPQYDLVHIVASRSPFDAGERERFFERCDALGFTAVYPPRAPAGPPGPYARVIEAEDLRALAAELPFSVWPSTDDRPFHYAIDAHHLRAAHAEGRLAEVLSGNPMLSLGASIGGLALLLTLVPIALVRVRGGARPAGLRRGWLLLAYFAGIGFGFMAIEISVLLRLQSYLGKPVYGLSVGLFAFLLASGIGSELSGRIASKRLVSRIVAITALLFVSVLAFYAFSGALFASTVKLNLLPRVAIAVAAIFPLALPLGTFFPIGVRLISQESEDLIPWAWGTNGCLSVAGILGTRIVALFAGFSTAMLLGLVAYALVAGCALAYRRVSRARVA